MKLTLSILFALLTLTTAAQTTTMAQDDFEGSGTITGWFGDDCGMNDAFANPYSLGLNTSATVLRYHDTGGQFANVRFQMTDNFDMSVSSVFSLKIYVPSSGLTGGSPNQISLKLQDGSLGSPWVTQSEIIKPIVLDQWQTVTFDFANDTYINLDGGSVAPTLRTDFNRVVIQVNGEFNFDHVLAYLDDVDYGSGPTTPTDPVFDNLVWADEFDVDGAVNSSNWFHQTLLPMPGSWFNGEIQHYTDRIDNAYVDGGILKIVAKKETFTDQGYTKQHTSARLNSKFAFKYGKVEIRAKLPFGSGTWPAMWTLGKNINEDGGYWDNLGYGTTGWPYCGEIDIMEHWGSNQNYVSSATHTPSSFGGTVNVGGQVISTASTAFHIYTLEWTAEKLVFSVDGNVHFTYNPAVKDGDTWPFNLEQYFLLNVAVLPDISPSFTSSALEIDYIRVYQESNCAVPTAVTTTVLSPTTATLSWNAVGDALGYEVTGGPVGGPTRSIKMTSTSKTIPILDPATSYQWMVRAYCDPDFSDQSALQTFTTPSIRKAAAGLVIAPNPSNGAVSVHVTGGFESIVELVDMNGKVRSRKQLSAADLQVEFANLPSGVYIVRLSNSQTETHEMLFVK